MPRKSTKSSANKASRYATTSIAAKPKPPSPVIAPKEEEEVEEVFVDPYTYYTSETLYFDEPLDEDTLFMSICRWSSLSSCTTHVLCDVKLIGEEEVPSIGYKFVNLSGHARGYTKTFRASNIKFWGGNTAIESGWVSPHDQGKITVESPADPNEKSKMYAYQMTFKYLPAEFKYETCDLIMCYNTFFVHIGSFRP
jgi:hypothetical protein